METERKLNRRFAGLQSSFFAAYAGTSFLAYILIQKGVPTVYVGIMGALMSCSSALIQPFWGVLCDRYGCHRIFYIASGIIMPLIYLWIILSGSAVELIICALLSGVFINCMQNMSNGWIAGLNAEGHSVNYGATRSFGSLAFAIMAVLLGKVADLWGFFALVAVMAVCGICSIGFSFSIPKIEATRLPGSGGSAPTLREGLKALFAQRDYMVMVLCGFLAMFGLAGIASYYPVLLAEMGANSTIIGIGTFTYGIAEVPFMLLYGWIASRFKFRNLFAVCLLAHALQCVLVGIAPNYIFAILAMSLQGLSFGTLVPSIQKYTADHIDRKYVSTAQLFGSAVSLSASMVFGNVAASLMNRVMTLRAMFLILALVSFSASLIYVLYTGIPVAAKAEAELNTAGTK